MLVMTDGRPHIHETLPVALDMVKPDRLVIHDDSGSRAVWDSLAKFGGELIAPPKRGGYAQAMRRAWLEAATWEGYIFHLEDDFVLLDAPVAAMVDTLEANPQLTQMALLRGPVNEAETAAGGIIESDPGAYTQRDGWIESAKWFTCNPCVYHSDIPRRWRWQASPNSEWRMSRRILRDGRTSGYWGRIGDPPRVEHVGKRSGWGY